MSAVAQPPVSAIKTFALWGSARDEPRVEPAKYVILVKNSDGAIDNSQRTSATFETRTVRVSDVFIPEKTREVASELGRGAILVCGPLNGEDAERMRDNLSGSSRANVNIVTKYEALLRQAIQFAHKSVVVYAAVQAISDARFVECCRSLGVAIEGDGECRASRKQ